MCVEGVCGWGVRLCGCTQVFVKEFEDLQSSNMSLFFFSFLFKATRAKSKPHGPTEPWGQWFWTLHGPRPLIPTEKTLPTSTCPSMSTSAGHQPCWAVRLSPSLSAISLLPFTPSPPLPLPAGSELTLKKAAVTNMDGHVFSAPKLF